MSLTPLKLSLDVAEVEHKRERLYKRQALVTDTKLLPPREHETEQQRRARFGQAMVRMIHSLTGTEPRIAVHADGTPYIHMN